MSISLVINSPRIGGGGECIIDSAYQTDAQVSSIAYGLIIKLGKAISKFSIDGQEYKEPTPFLSTKDFELAKRVTLLLSKEDFTSARKIIEAAQMEIYRPSC